jgi:hypothetical protein
MRRLPVVAFVTVLIVHATALSWNAARTASLWATPVAGSFTGGIDAYLRSGNWWLGLSYASSAAFVTYAFMRLRAGQKSGAVGMVGGMSLVGILYFAGCFLLGCCGSPMLIVYLNLFGASFLGFTKPLVLALTVVSIVLGYLWMERQSKKGCVDCATEGGTCQ